MAAIIGFVGRINPGEQRNGRNVEVNRLAGMVNHILDRQPVDPR